VVAGLHACAEVFKVRPEAITEIWLQASGGPISLQSAIESAAGQHKVPIRVVSEQQLQKVSRGHQGVICFVSANPQFSWEDLSQSSNGMVLILDGIEDPQNLGAILRTAWLTNVLGVIIPKDRAVGITTAVTRVASGGVEHVPVLVSGNLIEPLKRLKDCGFWIYGLAEKGSNELWQMNFPEKVAWVVGSEDRGLRTTSERQCDELVHLFQAPTGSSYNASVAVALAAYETLRQWQVKN
jgi:23S rRNA (guanosine2251-2'-O)-methyltransferase